MRLNLTEYIDREISEYCEYHWDNYRCADNSPFNLVDFRNCYAFQVIKNAYNETEPKASLRAHRRTDNDDVRMQDSRNIAYAQHYRNLQYQDMLNWTGYGEPELLPDDVKSMEGKLTGHKKTAMQYFELETIARHPLLKSITNKRVCDVKKISNEVFIEYMKDYDALTASLVKGLDGNDEDVIFSAIALYTLEWKYQVELFYACAVNAEQAKSTDIPHSKIAALCADCQMPIYTNFPFVKNLYIQSRFVLHRLKLVPLLYNGSSWDEVKEAFVLDSKYYKYGERRTAYSLPGTDSIIKQIAYGKYVENNREHPELNVGGDRIYNAFILPFSSEKQNPKVFGYATTTYEDNDKPYHKIYGILLDVKDLMYHHVCHNKSKITLLANTIKEYIKKAE